MNISMGARAWRWGWRWARVAGRWLLRVLLIDLPIFTAWVLAAVLLLVSLLEHHWLRSLLTVPSAVYATRMYGEILQALRGGPRA